MSPAKSLAPAMPHTYCRCMKSVYASHAIRTETLTNDTPGEDHHAHELSHPQLD